MTKNLLVELGLEELPAYVVTPSEKQLGEKMAAFLDDNRLSYESIQTFSTPRRLAVRVIGLADQQSDLTEDFKGPSKKIALDARYVQYFWKIQDQMTGHDGHISELGVDYLFQFIMTIFISFIKLRESFSL